MFQIEHTCKPQVREEPSYIAGEGEENDHKIQEEGEEEENDDFPSFEDFLNAREDLIKQTKAHLLLDSSKPEQ